MSVNVKNKWQQKQEEEKTTTSDRTKQVKMMALGVHPPNFLDLASKTLSEDFADFRQAWEIYVVAAEIEDKSDVIKVALLKNFLGTEAVKVLNTLLAPAAQITTAAILAALAGYCVPQTNETYERYIFNTAVQGDQQVRHAVAKTIGKLQLRTVERFAHSGSDRSGNSVG